MGKQIEEEVRNITNVDYGHFLPNYSGKCNHLHYHTSWNIGVTLKGEIIAGERMLIDFGEVKRVVKEAVNFIDHKMIVPMSAYKETTKDGRIKAEYENRTLILPIEEVALFDKDSTAENIADYLAGQILTQLPLNINSVTIHFSEGVNNYISAEAVR